MPLSAYVNGDYVYGPSITEGTWQALRRMRNREVRLPCGRDGFLRVSPRGTKHFVHHANHEDCPWANESPDHVDAKCAIVAGLAADPRTRDWTVRTEQCGPDWRADVLATSPDGRRRVAFEVQLSEQSFEETVARQVRFSAAGVEGVWLFREPPRRRSGSDTMAYWEAFGGAQSHRDGAPLPHLPLFRLFRDEEGAWRVRVRRDVHQHGYAEWVWDAQPGTRPLSGFVAAWLCAAPAPVRPLLAVAAEWVSRLWFLRTACPRCSTDTLLHAMTAPQMSACGVRVSERLFAPVYEEVALAHVRAYGPFGFRTRARVAAHLATDDGRHLLEEAIAARYVYLEAEDAVRFACPRCPHVYTDAAYAALAAATPPLASLLMPMPAGPGWVGEPGRDQALDDEHWCLAPADAVCPTQHAREPEQPGEPYVPIAERLEAMRAERDAWPVPTIFEAIQRACERAGWQPTPGQSQHTGLRSHLGTFTRGADRVLVFIGAEDWTPDGMRQVVEQSAAAGRRVLWFVRDPALADHPLLRHLPVVPLRAERTGATRWCFSVVLGLEEEHPLGTAVATVLQTP